MLKYYAFVVGSWLIPFIPVSVGHAFASIVGEVLYRLLPEKKRIVRENLECVLEGRAGQPELEKTARTVFRNLAKNYFDLFWLTKLKPDDVGKVIKVTGWELFEEVYAKGKGVIAITAHFGDLDVVGQFLASRSVRTTVPAEPLKPPKLFEFVKQQREGKGVSFVPVGSAGLRSTIQALQKGELVAMAVDRDIQKSGKVVRFFCGEASMPTGAVALALRTGAALLPAFCYRLPDRTFEIRIEKALDLVTTGDKEEDIMVNLRKIVRVLEKHIGSRPDHWVVMEPIFRAESRKELSNVS